VETRAAAFLFDFRNPVEFVGIGFEVVVGVIEPGDGVEAGTVGLALGDDYIRHANDGRRVHAAGEFGEDRTVGAEAAVDRRGQGGAEVFFVFGIVVIADALARIKIPIFSDDVLCIVLSWT
jgi:hypothetical protein